MVIWLILVAVTGVSASVGTDAIAAANPGIKELQRNLNGLGYDARRGWTDGGSRAISPNSILTIGSIT